jgi:hypothetical protein
MGRFNGIQPEIRKQAACLLKWATEKSVFLSDHYWEKLEKFDATTREHSAFLDTQNKRVIKCTKPGKFGMGHGSDGRYGNHCDATPYFYLRRLELTNQLFRTDFRLEGVALGEPEFGADKTPAPYAVTSQKFIEATKPEHPSEEEIICFMLEMGFTMLENSCYNWVRDDGFIVTDTKELNFINSIEGIVPIDLIISKAE